MNRTRTLSFLLVALCALPALSQDLIVEGKGANDKHVAPGDQASVALLALQGLHQVVEEKDRKIAELEGRLEALERLMAEMAGR